ncbi:hypothetical protein BASA81_001466 [Batrachochytrium salamandrivorans]|nr:hypothetical protein BASA81_001466 [Batrachochytrium salamandrivorans]
MSCFALGGFPQTRPSLKGDPKPCYFPFTFNGVTYRACADFSKAQPFMTPSDLNELEIIHNSNSWCSLGPTYSATGSTKKMWGYCVCGVETESPTSAAPTKKPTSLAPTKKPTKTPTARPTATPTKLPTKRPTTGPTPPTPRPTLKPTTQYPTTKPTTSAPTTASPTFLPTKVPTTPYPTYETPSPTFRPSTSPTIAPIFDNSHQVLAIGAGVAATVAFFCLFVLLCTCCRRCSKNRRERRDTVIITDIVPIHAVSPANHHSKAQMQKPTVTIPASTVANKTPKAGGWGARRASAPPTASPDDIESQKPNKQPSVPFSLTVSNPEMMEFSGRNAPLPMPPPPDRLSQSLLPVVPSSSRNSLPPPPPPVVIDDVDLPPPPPPSRAPETGGFMAQMLAKLPRRESTASQASSSSRNNKQMMAFAKVPSRKVSTSSWDTVEEKADEVAPSPVPVATNSSATLTKYERMQKAGLPVDAIKHAMVKDGVPLSAFPGLSHSGML